MLQFCDKRGLLLILYTLTTVLVQFSPEKWNTLTNVNACATDQDKYSTSANFLHIEPELGITEEGGHR